MTIYTKTTDFQAKDALASGNPLKIVKGTEIDDEFDAIAIADATNLKKDGTVTVTGNIPMGTYKLTGLGTGSAATDSANLAQIQAGAYQLIGSISGVDTITGSLSPAISAYAAGQKFSFVAAGANTGAATININGLGAKSITKLGTTALAAGDLPSGAVVEIEYDGTQFQLCNLVAVPLSAQIFNNLTTVTLDTAADYVAIADGSDSGNAKKALLSSATTTASGIVELATDAEVQTGTDTSRVPSVSSMRNGLLVSGSLIATTSGTTAESTGIPSWAKRVTLTIVGVSVSGTGNILVQAGTSGGFVTTGYLGAGVVVTDAAATSGFVVTTGFDINTLSASNVLYGRVTLVKHDSDTWTADGVLSNTAAASCFILAGSIALGGTLDRVRLATTGGNTFDAGAFKAHYE